MTTVVIADDEDLFRSGLRMIVEAAPGVDVLAEAADGEQAVERGSLACSHRRRDGGRPQRHQKFQTLCDRDQAGG